MTPPARATDIARHTDFLLLGARRLTRNEADARDLVQDTYLRALEALQRTPQAPENMRAWLVVIMRNGWFNVVRGRRTQFGARAALAAEAVDDGMVDMRVSYPQFARAWSQLPETARAIATQCLLDGDPYDVVSGRMGVTAATIATSIHRTRRQLRESMFGRTGA